jgi:hypothetical protein
MALRAHLPHKIAVLLGLSVGICVPYFALQHFVFAAPRTPWITPLDLRIAFEPRWIWVYASLALLVPLAPLLTPTRDGLARYVHGLAWLCVTSFVAFLVLPVAGPRPPEIPAQGLYAMIVAVDRPLNSLPSLHAGLTAYSLLHLARVATDARSAAAGRRFVVLGVAWGVAILFSTLATKQHWVVDLPFGMALAWAAHAWAWRAAPRARETLALAAD